MRTIDELGISPAPWTICDFCADHIGVSASSGRRVADVCTTANARLIAAAPELYEALRKMQECFDYIRSTAWFMDANFASIRKMIEAQNEAKSALAKASGEVKE